MKWYHSHETLELNTPSRLDAVDFETEARYRKEGARFIMEIGNKLGLPYLTMASGIVFYHRFYMFHSFKEFSRWVTAPTCLFLAGKVEETPKKCRDILKVTQQSLPDHRFKAFGDHPREEVMIIERILLQTIKFDLHLSHPYTYLIKFGKLLKGDMEKINGFVQKAWIFINDSLSTTLCLVYKPHVIGLAVLLLAFKLSNENISDFLAKPRPDWWKMFHQDAKEPELEEICEELTNMYKGKPPKRRCPDVVINNKLKGSPLPPGSPSNKKLKLQLPLSGSPLAVATPNNAAQATSATTSTTTATTVSGVATTTSSVATTASSVTTTQLPPPPKPVVSTSNSFLSIATANPTPQPMQLATPTTKVSFVINAPVTSSTTKNNGVMGPKSSAPLKEIPHPNPLPPPAQPVGGLPQQPPQPQKLDLVSPKAQRHEQLKSFMQHQQHLNSSPSGGGNLHSPMRGSGPVATAGPGMQHQPPPQRSGTVGGGQPQPPQQSPFKPTAPILDHMSSFFQSTPPSKSQQPPALQQPLQQPPPPMPLHQVQPQHHHHLHSSNRHLHHSNLPQQPPKQKSMLEQLHQLKQQQQQHNQQQPSMVGMSQHQQQQRNSNSIIPPPVQQQRQNQQQPNQQLPTPPAPRLPMQPQPGGGNQMNAFHHQQQHNHQQGPQLQQHQQQQQFNNSNNNAGNMNNPVQPFHQQQPQTANNFVPQQVPLPQQQHQQQQQQHRFPGQPAPPPQPNFLGGIPQPQQQQQQHQVVAGAGQQPPNHFINNVNALSVAGNHQMNQHQNAPFNAFNAPQQQQQQQQALLMSNRMQQQPQNKPNFPPPPGNYY